MLAEQVNPYTNAPISVSPLTWSHATVVSTAIKYLEKLEELQLCPSCHAPDVPAAQPRHGGGEEPGHASAGSTPSWSRRKTARPPAPSASSSEADPAHRGQPTLQVTLAIDTRDCIGCDVCVAHCDRGVLRMLDGKAMIDLRNLDECDADGRCVQVCPTRVVSLTSRRAGGRRRAASAARSASAETAHPGARLSPVPGRRPDSCHRPPAADRATQGATPASPGTQGDCPRRPDPRATPASPGRP